MNARVDSTRLERSGLTHGKSARWFETGGAIQAAIPRLAALGVREEDTGRMQATRVQVLDGALRVKVVWRERECVCVWRGSWDSTAHGGSPPSYHPELMWSYRSICSRPHHHHTGVRSCSQSIQRSQAAVSPCASLLMGLHRAQTVRCGPASCPASPRGALRGPAGGASIAGER